MFSITKDIGMDLGTASVLIYIKDKGIVLNPRSWRSTRTPASS